MNDNIFLPITYPSAGEFWLSSAAIDTRYSAAMRKLINLPDSFNLRISVKDARTAAYYLGISTPLSLVTYNSNDVRHNGSYITRFQRNHFPANSFVCIKINNLICYLASPELCFLLAPRYLSFAKTVQFGNDLCAQYRKNCYAQYNQTNCKAITSKKLISDFIEQAGKFGCHKTAAKAIRFVHDDSNSPAESALSTAVALPWQFGGYKLGNPVLNYRIDLPLAETRLVKYGSIRVDMAWPAKKFAIEYNSSLTHSNSSQMSQDYNRLTALKRCGWSVVCLTAANLSDFDSIETIMTEIRQMLNLPAEETASIKYKELRKQVMCELFNHHS